MFNRYVTLPEGTGITNVPMKMAIIQGLAAPHLWKKNSRPTKLQTPPKPNRNTMKSYENPLHESPETLIKSHNITTVIGPFARPEIPVISTNIATCI